MNGEQVGVEERIHHPAYEVAATITRQSWLDAGMTPEELEHDTQIAEAFERWVQAGHAPEGFFTPAIGSKLPEGNVAKSDSSLISEEQAQHLAGKAWIPREFRCSNCQELARLDVTRQLNKDELTARYVCAGCGCSQTWHFHGRSLDDA